HHLDRHAILFVDPIVKGSVCHFTGLDQFAMQRIELEPAYQICDLIERTVTAIERPAHFRSRVIALMSDTVDEKVDALLRRHLLQMKTEREDDSRAAVHAPEEHADAVFWRLGKIQIPEQH